VATLVREGRWEFLRRFPRTASFDVDGLPDPASPASFEASKLDWAEAERHIETLLLHRDLLRLRRDDPIISRQDATMLHGAVISGEAFILRWCDAAGDDRLLLVNLGRDVRWEPVAEPLMAAPLGARWKVKWSSDWPRYGGSGSGLLDARNWLVPGHAATLLQPATIEGSATT
jgi:maltooligosyltrehalose trehalohydrolase